jgi:hypothetical protein
LSPPASLTPGRTRPSGGSYGVATSILEGLDEMLTVNRLGLPAKLRRVYGALKHPMGKLVFTLLLMQETKL